MTTVTDAVPTTHTDPVNAQILAISEDRIQGFVRDPFAEISRLSGVDVATVIERVQAMLRAGTIRRGRQPLMATNLPQRPRVPCPLPPPKIKPPFDFMLN